MMMTEAQAAGHKTPPPEEHASETMIEVAGMYDVDFTEQKLGFRVKKDYDQDCLVVGKIVDENIAKEMEGGFRLKEGDEIYGLNGFMLKSEVAPVTTHEAFGREINKIEQRPLTVTFIDQNHGKNPFDLMAEAAADAVKAASNAVGETLGLESQEGTQEEKGGEQDSVFRRESRYEIKEANEWDADISDAFDNYVNGYKSFCVKYTKYLPIPSFNQSEYKIDRGYVEFGMKVIVKGYDQMGIIVHHHKTYDTNKQGKREWTKENDVCDVRLQDGYTLKGVVLDDLTPIEIHYINLACGLSLEDLCLYISCLGCVWGSLCVVFGMLMFAQEETSATATALMSFFYMGIMFVFGLVTIVYIGRTLHFIQEDEANEIEEEIKFGEGDHGPLLHDDMEMYGDEELP